MIHRAAPDFWVYYNALPIAVQALADRAFALLKTEVTPILTNWFVELARDNV